MSDAIRDTWKFRLGSEPGMSSNTARAVALVPGCKASCGGGEVEGSRGLEAGEVSGCVFRSVFSIVQLGFFPSTTDPQENGHLPEIEKCS